MLKVDPEVLVQDVEGELVLLHLGTEEYFGLNRVGAEVWQEIQEHGDLEKTCAALVSKYGEPEEEQVRREVEALVGELIERRLLREAD